MSISTAVHKIPGNLTIVCYEQAAIDTDILRTSKHWYLLLYFTGILLLLLLSWLLFLTNPTPWCLWKLHPISQLCTIRVFWWSLSQTSLIHSAHILSPRISWDLFPQLTAKRIIISGTLVFPSPHSTAWPWESHKVSCPTLIRHVAWTLPFSVATCSTPNGATTRFLFPLRVLH